TARNLESDLVLMTATDAEGDFDLLNAPPGSYRILAESGQALLFFDTVDLPSARLELVSALGHRLEGIVRLAGGETPLPGFLVRLVILDGEVQISRDGVTDSDGGFSFGDLPSGEYGLRFSAPSPHGPFLAYPPFFEKAVDLTRDAQREDIRYPSYPAGTLRLRFLRGENGSPPGVHEGEVEIELVKHRRGGLQIGGLDSGGKRPTWKAYGTFEKLLRAGEYDFLCRSEWAGKALELRIAAAVDAGQVVEREVLFSDE
ncbi:MAG: carboxypeptidase regulatory-like domain-containing protein, partial [Planctomycetes bacterium]|nr:carboxypeptidase regulatory-like domain-containing protein [Planctomycetota bacterium]